MCLVSRQGEPTTTRRPRLTASSRGSGAFAVRGAGMCAALSDRMSSLRSVVAFVAFVAVASSTHSAFAGEPNATFNVSIHADAPVWLEVEDKEAHTWTRICEAPCEGVALPTGLRYRVRGEGIRPTRAVEGTPGALMSLDVTTSAKSTFVAGFVVLGVGSAAMISGTVLYIASLAKLWDATDDGHDQRQVAGAVVLGGLVGAVVGGGIIASSARSSLDDTPRPKSRERASFPLPAVWSVPIFATTF